MNSIAKALNVNCDTAALKIVSRAMESAGYEVLEAASGLECLEIVKKQKPDIVLLEVVLPDIDGLEICRRIKQDAELCDVFVICLSSVRTSSENRAEALEAGADGSLNLPIEPRELVAEVQSLLRIKESQSGKSEKLLRSMFETAPDAMLLLDESLRVEFCNKKAVAAFGYAEQEMKGMRLQDLLHSEFRDTVKRLANAFSREGAIFETRHLRKDGSVFPAEVGSSPLQLGAHRRFVYSIRDLTQRKQTKEQYRILFEKNPIPMWIYDTETFAFLAVNNAAVEHYGYTPDEFLLMTIKDIRPPEDVPLLMSRLQDFSSGYHYAGVWRHKKRDGAIIYAEIVWHVLAFSEKRSKLVMARDVTDRYMAEEEQARLQLRIRNAAMEWQRTFDAIESLVLILDSTGTVKRMNRAARDLSETTYHKCIGRPVNEIGSGEPWQKISEAAKAVQATQAAFSCQARDELTGRSWDIDATLFIRPVSKPGPDSERIIIVVRDTTKIAQLQESLRHNETLSAMGSLTAAVAHEVRNPIFSIQATLDAFEARFGIKEEYKRHLGILRNEVSRLAELMQDLLDYGKPPVLEFSEGSLADIIGQAINACRNAADRMRVAIINDVEEDLAAIRRDPGRLFQAFQNIIENSIQHSPPGAIVTVEAKPAFLDNRRWIDCIVKDSGAGFKTEDLPKIFEPFFSKRRGGIGLGLAIVHRIVEEHGGIVFAENRPEGGSMMTVRLPV